MKTVLKLVTALAAIAGIVYAVATYGDKIVAWAKRILEKCPCKCCVECNVDISHDDEEAPEEEVAEEAPAEEAPVPTEGEPVAEDADFEA